MNDLQKRERFAELRDVGAGEILERLPLGIFVVDARGTILAVNPQQEVNSGISAREVVGGSLVELFGDRLRRYGLMEPLRRLLTENTPFTTELAGYEPQFLRKLVRFKLWGFVVEPGRKFAILTDGVDQAERQAPHIVGESASMETVFTMIERSARVDATLLVLGETGTGKELVARAIHAQSRRGRGPFLAINCGALPEQLLESALFGHEKGAFTGADRRVKGYFEAASGGTLFLDEIGETSPSFQVKLLRVLETRSVTRLGGTAPLDVDVRVICATNRNLEEEVRAGRFRGDLFYRINVLQLRVPPLRDRLEDLPLLVTHFLHEVVQKYGLGEKVPSPAVLERLQRYPWPGNVRELANVIESAYVVAPGGTIEEQHLPRRILDATETGLAGPGTVSPYEEARRQFQRRYLEQVLRLAGGDMKTAARLAGVHPSTLYRIQARTDRNG